MRNILILTQSLWRNYGGILQAYALQEYLRGLGHRVVTDRNYRATEPLWAVRRVRHALASLAKGGRSWKFDPAQTHYGCEMILSSETRKFVECRMQTVEAFKRYGVADMAVMRQFDTFVVGSDQVWRPIYNTRQEQYFLKFAQKMQVRRVAYAVSFGTDQREYSDEQLRVCAPLAQRFDAVSVREESGVALTRELFGVEAEHVLDPTMLLDREHYLELCSSIPVQESCVAAYFLHKSQEAELLLEELTRSLGCGVRDVIPNGFVSQQDYLAHEQCREPFPAVEQWLAMMRDANFVLTDSFHGVVFSILFEKPFAVVVNKQRGASRFTSLFEMLGIEGRVVETGRSLDAILATEIDYAGVAKKLEKLRVKSADFLKKALR